MDETKPLVLDVDGTFLKTDLLFETFWAGMGTAPLPTLRAVLRHVTDPARLKAELAAIAPLRADLLPVNSDMADVAMEALKDGREVVLASASNEGLVEDLAREYGLSERVFASSATKNMKGEVKARALVGAFGEEGFDYAGNAPADLAIWEQAHTALVVGDAGAARGLMSKGKLVRSYSDGWKMRDLARAIRPHQWVKNVLLLLPLVAAHQFAMAPLILALIGIVSFSAAASSIYLVNDLLDLEADRLHQKKRNRPFASGAVPIHIGMIAAAVLALFALAVAVWLGAAFFGTVVLYMALSLSYSLRLKRQRWIDIATLAGLYTLRVVAGGAAIGAFASGYMLVFIFPVFVTLAAVKRLTELTLASDDARLPGRGYGKPDRGDLHNVAWLGMVGALLAFFLYTFTDQAVSLYPTRWLLWAAMVPLALWLRRMVRLGYLGKQDYDPLVFAMKDKRGIGLILITLSIMFWAAGLWQDWFGL